MKAGSKRRKILFFLFSLFFIVVALVGFFYLIQIPAFINSLGAVLGEFVGFSVKVKDLSLSPELKGEISDLQITSLKDRNLSFLCSNVSIKSKVHSSLKGEIESIILTEPRLSFKFGEKKGKTNLSFLKKLPAVHLLTIQKGELEFSFPDHPQVITLSDLTLDVRDFSPRKGGAITFQSLLRVASKNGGAEGVGWSKGQLHLTSLFPTPTGKGFVEFHIDSGSYLSTSFQNLVLRCPINLDKEKVEIDPASLTLDSVSYSRNGKDTTLRNMRFQTSLLYDLTSDILNSTISEGRIVNVGDFKGSLRVTLHGDFPWNASMEAQSIDLGEVFSLFKPLLPGEYQKWSLQGKGAVKTRLEGNYSGETPGLNGDVIFQFHQGGFSSADGTKAGQGITGEVIMKLKSPQPNKKVDLEISSEVDGGEFLWEAYYKDFSGVRGNVFAQANFFLDTHYPIAFQGTTDLFGTGKYSFSGLIQSTEFLFYWKAEEVSPQKLLSVFLSDYISQNYPSLKDLHVEGDAYVEMATVMRGDALFFEGIVKIHDSSLVIPSTSFSLSQLNLMLPFNLFYPSSANQFREVKEKRSGVLLIGTLKKDAVMVENVNIPLVSFENAIVIPEKIVVPLFGGRLEVLYGEGIELISPARRFDFGVRLEKIDLGLLSEHLVHMTIPGILEAEFPMLRYHGGEWTARGKAIAKIFGGEVEATNLSARNLFSGDRRIGADVSFKGIDLGSMTEKIQIGKMKGVIQGSVRNLEIEYGQPSRFILDIDSVKTKGVEQKVSVDAIKNISILGTGYEGISEILSSGINRFFREYPYSRIGIWCTLENDKFSVRGKIFEGSTEYLVRRAFLRGIDVVNQNPQNVISFKDMQERIGRILRAREGKISTKE
ncbi:MAG: hypothetical protein FJ243_00340 [Nitrospira sp.]|nr:hypothetical protein [Nitrospira sp.]